MAKTNLNTSQNFSTMTKNENQKKATRKHSMSLTTSNTNCTELQSEFQKSVLDGGGKFDYAPLGMNVVTAEIDSPKNVVLDTISFSVEVGNNSKAHRIFAKFCKSYNGEILGFSEPKIAKKDFCTYTFTFSVSSKILGKHYFDGITKYNYKDVLNKINEIVPISIKEEDLKVYILHNKIDVIVNNPAQIISFIKRLSYNSALFNKFQYQKVADNGTVYQKTNNTKNRKESVTIYNKSKELLMGRNAKLREVLPEEELCIGRIRFEAHLNYPRMINKYFFNVESHKLHTLKEILEQPVDPPVSVLIREIFPYDNVTLEPCVQLDNAYKNITGVNKIFKDAGARLICFLHDNDPSAIKSFFKEHTAQSSSISRDFKNISKFLSIEVPFLPEETDVAKKVILHILSDFQKDSTSEIQQVINIVKEGGYYAKWNKLR